MLTSFPDLDRQGGNLVVEAILRGILFAAEERQCSTLILSMCSWTTVILTNAQL